MESPNPGEAFEATFDAATNAALVNGLRRAYETACEHFVPGLGSTEVTFGFNLYHHAVFELAREAERLPEAIDVTSRRPIFRLKLGEYELACHRVGRSERENIGTSFPKNEGAAGTMLEEQLWLPTLTSHLGVEKARKLILAHLGNPEEGLRAVYLCVPGKTENGRITAWAFTREVWRIEDAARPRLAPSSQPSEEVVAEPVVRRRTKEEPASPPEEQVDEATVQRKPKKNEHEENG